jgi:hypothetical protein
LKVKLNGTALTRAPFAAKSFDHPYDAALGEDSRYACFHAPLQKVHKGSNQISVELSRGGPDTIKGHAQNGALAQEFESAFGAVGHTCSFFH